MNQELNDLLRAWRLQANSWPKTGPLSHAVKGSVILEHCADRLEEVLRGMEGTSEMDPHNTSGDRPKHI